MNRVPWAPLNGSVFLIILGGLILASLLTGLNIFAVFPLVLIVVGIAGVGYSFRKSSPGTPKTSTS